MRRLQTRRTTMGTARVVACVAAVLLVGSRDAAAAPEQAALARLFSCDAPRPVLADFDGNGELDRIDVGGANRGSIWITFNNGTPAVLRHADGACRVVVSDLDRDRDADLVAVTRAGHLLLWLNDGHALREVRPLRARERPDPDAALVWHAQAHRYACAGGRTIPHPAQPAAPHALDRCTTCGVHPVNRRRGAAASVSPSRAPPAP